MKVVIRDMDWFKRRVPTPQPKPFHVTVDDLQLIDNYRCDMVAVYDDGSVYELDARVMYNDIKGTWTVHGIDSKGHSVLCDIEV